MDDYGGDEFRESLYSQVPAEGVSQPTLAPTDGTQKDLHSMSWKDLYTMAGGGNMGGAGRPSLSSTQPVEAGGIGKYRGMVKSFF